MVHDVLVSGAGKIGRAVARFLAASGDYSLRVADPRLEAAEEAVRGLAGSRALAIELGDAASLDRAMQGARAVISCAPFHANPLIAERARAGGLHYLDLTEDVETTRLVGELARGAECAFVPQCGLAPGFVTIVGAALIEGLETIDELRLRVGALPRHPANRLHYNLTWSTEGLINEYCNPCEALVDGEPVLLPPLEQREEFRLDGVRYEAFSTSGGIGSLARTLRGRARSVQYKTIRFPGHAELLKLLLHDLRFREHRSELARILERAVPTTSQDQVVIFVSADGRVGGELVTRSWARTIRHREHAGRAWSAIQLTTAAGVCAVLDLLLAGRLPQRGLVRQEDVRLEDFLSNRFGALYEPAPA